MSYESALRQAGFSVEVIPNQGRGAAMARIESARRLFGSIWFNEATTAAGIEALGWYHEKKDDVRIIGLGPEHDWSSHAPMLLGLCALPQRMVSGLQGQRALSARAVRWRFE